MVRPCDRCEQGAIPGASGREWVPGTGKAEGARQVHTGGSSWTLQGTQGVSQTGAHFAHSGQSLVKAAPVAMISQEVQARAWGNLRLPQALEVRAQAHRGGQGPGEELGKEWDKMWVEHWGREASRAELRACHWPSLWECPQASQSAMNPQLR